MGYKSLSCFPAALLFVFDAFFIENSLLLEDSIDWSIDGTKINYVAEVTTKIKTFLKVDKYFPREMLLLIYRLLHQIVKLVENTQKSLFDLQKCIWVDYLNNQE